MADIKNKLATVEIVEYMCDALTPTTLPNPEDLNFTGGVNATYNGSSAVTISLPTELTYLDGVTDNIQMQIDTINNDIDTVNDAIDIVNNNIDIINNALGDVNAALDNILGV